MKGWKKLGVIVAAVTMGVAALATMSAGASSSSANGILRDVSGTRMGAARLFTMGDGKILVQVSVSGLTPGFHGFHIHTIGSCDASGIFVSAGGHFNPGATTHGSHAGDQPVILVNADGTGMARFATDRYVIGDLFDADGSAFIVHAAADNYANVPTRYTATGAIEPGPDAATLATGDAGTRTLCGMIKPA